MTTFPPGLVVGSNAGPGVDSHRLLDHQTILDQLPDVSPGVGVGDLVDLVRVQPHLTKGTLSRAVVQRDVGTTNTGNYCKCVQPC